MSIPGNTTAIIYLPTANRNDIFENDKSLLVQKEVILKGVEKGRTIVEVGSGNYHFVVKQKTN